MKSPSVLDHGAHEHLTCGLRLKVGKVMPLVTSKITWPAFKTIQLMAYCHWVSRCLSYWKDILRLIKADVKRKLRVKAVLKTAEACYDRLFTDIGLPEADKASLHARCESEGFSFLAGTLPTLNKALLRGLASGVFNCPTSFRVKRGTRLPVFLGSLFSQVFHEDGTLRGSDCSPIAIQELCQILGLVYKASVPRDPSKDDAVIERFIEVENELTGFRIDDDALLRTANLVIRDLFSDYDRSKLVFKHGPGVTSDTPIAEKFEAAVPPMPATFSFAKSFFFNERDEQERLWRAPRLSNFDLFEGSDVARVLLVDKDYRGPRLISCEPSCLQWLQQGIKDYIYKKVGSHELTKGAVNFVDQTPSRDAALRASVDQSLSTLDLKDASDRVSLALVFRLFDGTSILDDMILTRSSRTKLPDGRVVVLNKFAPMGSALCFPVMAVSIYALILSYMVGLGYDLSAIRDQVTIFGDDVIVPTAIAKDVVQVLERYGLRVNHDKCFIDSPFAEACGGDYFRGNQVTPIRIKTLWHDLRQEKDIASSVASLVPVAHHFDRLGYTNLAEFLYREVEKTVGRLPYGYSFSDYLCRLHLPYMEKSSWEMTIENRSKPVSAVRVASAIADQKLETTWTSVWGHKMRIEPNIGVSQAPLPGEFNKRSSLRLEWRKIQEDKFYAYPANKFVPERSLKTSQDPRAEARRRLAQLNGL